MAFKTHVAETLRHLSKELGEKAEGEYFLLKRAEAQATQFSTKTAANTKESFFKKGIICLSEATF